MRKLIAVAMALCMLIGAVCLLGSCDKADENTLVMATNAAFPPYEYKDGDKIVGIDAEIAEAIAAKLGMKLEIMDVDFDVVLTGVSDGKYDMGMAGITVTPDRQINMDFSKSYATGIQVIIVKDGSAISTLDDIFEFNADGDPVALKNPNMKVPLRRDLLSLFGDQKRLQPGPERARRVAATHRPRCPGHRRARARSLQRV